MTAQALVEELKSTREFFERSTRCLSEEDSGFRPADGMYTAAQQVAHAAQTVDWFVQGAGRAEGFDLDFEKQGAELAGVTSLNSAREWLGRAFDGALRFYGGLSTEELNRPLPEGPVMGGVPVWSTVGAITDHTAHHRGALTVYSRLLGKTPAMPYMDM